MTTEMKIAVNNVYTLTVSAPLLRGGFSISTTVSEKYVVSAAEKLMALVRELNA